MIKRKFKNETTSLLGRKGVIINCSKIVEDETNIGTIAQLDKFLSYFYLVFGYYFYY